MEESDEETGDEEDVKRKIDAVLQIRKQRTQTVWSLSCMIDL